MSKNKFSVEEIEGKILNLQRAGVNLKAHFVGNDKIIDQIINEIEFWYVLPELLTRPPIICLWGMTGVGKTDFVRRLVKELGLEKRSLEIQMTNKGTGNSILRGDSMAEILSSSSMQEDEQGVLLLDEMQRFRTVDEHGKEIHDYKYQDVWTLLSDGQFSRQVGDIEAEICDMILDSQMSIERDKIDDEQPEAQNVEVTKDGKFKVKKVPAKRKSEYHQWRYFSNRLKALLNLEEPIFEIAKWDNQKVLQVLMEKSQDKSLYKPKKYSKLLIFISGNLDEVYRHSRNVEEVDIDADVFHESTSGITFVSVKKALKKRFKPEQIARFGNVHIIYPSISKKNYEIIIQRCCQELVDSFDEKGGVKVNIEQSIYDFIYRNAVFPLQGTRPVFSTIFSLINNNLTKVAYFTVKNGCRVVKVSYDEETLSICGSTSKGDIILPCEGEVDKIKRIKREEDSDRKFLTIVHEAGHSVVYTALYGYVPRSIAIETASDDFNGFVYPDASVKTKENLEKEITVLLAGRAAEKIVFGDDHVTVGASSDFQSATISVGKMVRYWMMFDRNAHY